MLQIDIGRLDSVIEAANRSITSLMVIMVIPFEAVCKSRQQLLTRGSPATHIRQPRPNGLEGGQKRGLRIMRLIAQDCRKSVNYFPCLSRIRFQMAIIKVFPAHQSDVNPWSQLGDAETCRHQKETPETSYQLVGNYSSSTRRADPIAEVT